MPSPMSTQINPATGQPWKTGDTYGSSIVTIGPNGEFQLTGSPKPPVPPWQGPEMPSPDTLKLLKYAQQKFPPPPIPPVGVPPMPQGGPPPVIAQTPPPFMPLPPPQQVAPPFNKTAPPVAMPVPPPPIVGQQPDPSWMTQWWNSWKNQQQPPGPPVAQNQTTLPPTIIGPQVRQPSTNPFNAIPSPNLRNNGPLSRRGA